MRVLTRLERYFAKEIITAFALSLALYVGLFLVQSLLARGQYLAAMAPGRVFGWLAFQIPGFAVEAFPLAMVLAVLLVCGRLARERELLAVQAGAVSLVRVLRPVIAFGAGLVVLALVLAEFVVPRANERVIVSWWDGVDGGGQALARLAGRSLEVGGYTLAFARYDAATDTVVDVRLESWRERSLSVWFARSARLVSDPRGRSMGRSILRLMRYSGYTLDFAVLPLPEGSHLDRSLLNRLVPFANVGPETDAPLDLMLPQTRDELIARNAGGGFNDARSLSALWNEARSTDPGAREAALEFATRLALPFANLVVLLLAVPVAIAASRSTGAAFGLAFIITIGFYLALYAGRALGAAGLLPWMAPWLANVLFLVAGVIAINRARAR